MFNYQPKVGVNGARLGDLYQALPVSGQKIIKKMVEAKRPVLACNLDNGELSALQLPAFMQAAKEMNCPIMFEAGPGALKAYAKDKPQLPEYCAQAADIILQDTGYRVIYATHLDHNQIDAKTYYSGNPQDQESALQAALDRVDFALAQGFTSFATDTSTITELDKQTAQERLENVIRTGIEVFRRIYLGAHEAGIEVGNEGEVGDIGKQISTVEEALVYYDGLVEGLKDVEQELGIDFEKTPLIDVIALNLGSAHGYSFDENDKLVPYCDVTIDLKRAQEVAEAFAQRGLSIGVALHGFSGTPVEMAPKFIGIGIAKVNINTDWQAIMWKVLEAYHPALYRKVFELAREVVKKDPAKAEKLLTDDLDYDFDHAKNRIIFGYARKLFRDSDYWPLLEELRLAFEQGKEKRQLKPKNHEEAQFDYLAVRIDTVPEEEGLNSWEMLIHLTKKRVLDLMWALETENLAQDII
ncbi:MAG TPA: class II fructose-bisphosphate aldolase [Candidatus Wirthbacteria bacterium]|nr:class II fructose-bisphosphate aldolase [Candidatus Wirthbacteria bacterium]